MADPILYWWCFVRRPEAEDYWYYVNAPSRQRVREAYRKLFPDATLIGVLTESERGVAFPE